MTTTPGGRKSESVPFAAIPHVLATDPHLSDGAYRLYGLLLSFSRQEQVTWVGQDRLATSLRVSVDTVQRRVKELETAGLVSISRRGRGLTNMINILPVSEAMLRQPVAAPEWRPQRIEPSDAWARSTGAPSYFSGALPAEARDLVMSSGPFVYALFDAAGALLYIGYSSKVDERLRTHGRPSGRFHGVTGTWVAIPVATKSLARALEREQIIIHRPPMNDYLFGDASESSLHPIQETAPVRSQNTDGCGFSIEEEADEKNTPEHQRHQDLSETQVQASDTHEHSGDDARERIESRAIQEFLDRVPGLSDDDLWNMYAKATSASTYQDPGNRALAEALTQETRRRFLG
jgi:hypothetical protein